MLLFGIAGQLELRTVPQNLQPKVPEDVRREKKDLCRVWLQTGQCSRPHCPAAHCLNELKDVRDGGHGGHRPASSRRQVTLSPGLRPVKVVLCQSFSQGTNCDRGPSCTFAHGMEELHIYRARQVTVYTKYFSSYGRIKTTVLLVHCFKVNCKVEIFVVLNFTHPLNMNISLISYR